jgi:hypothetical protein
MATGAIVIGEPGASAAAAVPTTKFLTATNSTDAINWAGGTHITTNTPISGGSWSSDGSRFVFVDSAGDIRTVRDNDGSDTTLIVSHTTDGAVKTHPVWYEPNGLIIWSEKLAGKPATLAYAPSLGGPATTVALPPGYDYTAPSTSQSRSIVFVRRADSGGTPTGQADIYEITTVGNDGTLPSPTLAVADATSPAMGSAGVSMVWVRSDGQHNQIYRSDLGDVVQKQVTSDPTDHGNPAWSPDPVSDDSAVSPIAFTEGSKIFTAMDDGSQQAAPVATALTGIPAWQSHQRESMSRLAGADRYRTAVAVSEYRWNVPLSSQIAHAVVLARSDTFADALAGSALAAAKQGPLLLTATDSLNPYTKTELTNLSRSADTTAYILGGTGAISAQVEADVAAIGYHVVRLAGQNRYATAIEIAEAITPAPTTVVAATGVDFPDALSAGAAAGALDLSGSSAVVVLTHGGVLPAETKKYLDGLANSANPPRITAVGGESVPAVSAYPGAAAIVGSDRYQTAQMVASAFFPQILSAELAVGTDWPDALAGGSVGRGPLLLTRPNSLPPATAHELDIASGSLGELLVFGGTGVISDSTAKSAGTVMSGPDGYVFLTNP